MDNFLYTILGALLTFFGYQYFKNKGVERVEKKIKTRKNEINKMSLASLVNLANAIVARRDQNNK